jgi:hypothetical protein
MEVLLMIAEFMVVSRAVWLVKEIRCGLCAGAGIFFAEGFQQRLKRFQEGVVEDLLAARVEDRVGRYTKRQLGARHKSRSRSAGA